MPQQWRDYLAIALRHSERITRLVVELFELARLNATERLVDREPVVLAELVQDVAQKQGLKLQQQGLRLSLCPGDLLPFVWADSGGSSSGCWKTCGQCLPPRAAGGRRRSGVAGGGSGRPAGGDDGPGIPEHDLPHVFERFYQGKSGNSGDGHAGLGLAIVKGIMELDDIEVRVESRVRVGAALSFTLPIWPVESRRPL